MLVSQVSVISKLGEKKKKKNPSLQKYFLGTLRTFGKQNQYSRSLAQQTTCFRAKFLESRVNNNIEMGKAQLWAWRSSASNLYYGFGEEATDWFLVKEKVLASGWCKPICRRRQMILAQWKGYGFHTPQFHCWTLLSPGAVEVVSQLSVSSLQVLFVRPMPAKSGRDPSG